VTIIHAHIHFWDPFRFDYSWLEGPLDRAFLPVGLDIAASSVGGAVFVQADCSPAQAFPEAEWGSSLGAPVGGVVAFAPLEQGDAVRSSLDALTELRLVRGVRRNLQDMDDDFFAQPSLLEGLEALAQRGLSFDACVRWWQLPSLYELVVEVPELVVVLDHLGKPPVSQGWKSEAAAIWHRGVRSIAALDRVSVKLSGLAPEVGRKVDLHEASRPFLDASLDAFSVARCMVGSDWPVSACVPTERAYGSWFSIVLEGLNPDEYSQVAFGTANRIYRLDDFEQSRA
jgi:L-fuconolactonase